jgi:hypothetical protein
MVDLLISDGCAAPGSTLCVLAITQRYSHLSPAALDTTIRLLENRKTLRAVGDSFGHRSETR